MSDTTKMPPSIFTAEELEDARAEMEAEREARAGAWERAREQVKRRKEALRVSTTEGAPWSPALITLQAQRLVVALDEMERLEGGAS